MENRVKIRALLLVSLIAAATASPASTEWPTPLDLGAVGDGTADDTTLVQQALDAGTVVHLAGATYRITSPLSLATGRTLLGPGSLIVDFDSGTATDANAAVHIVGNDVHLGNVTINKQFIDGSLASGVRASGVSNLRLDSVTIQGYSARPGIVMVDCRNFQIGGCTIGGFTLGRAVEIVTEPMAGIYLIDTTDGLIVNNVIRGFEVGPDARGQGYLSYGIYARKAARLCILRNQISIAGEGVHFVDARDSAISGNRIGDIWSYGVSLVRSSFVTVGNNHIDNAYQGISLSGDEQVVDPGCIDPAVGSKAPLAGVVGSVIGGNEDPEGIGETLARIGDGNYSTRSTISQAGPVAFSFVIDLLQETRFSDLTLVSERNYRPGGQFPGGAVSLAVSSSPTGPFVDGGGAILECSRPPGTEMTATNSGACATQTEARRIVMAQPVTTRYVRVSATFCLDNIVLISEAYANQGPIVRRVRPIGDAYQNFPRIPAMMTDGNASTYYNPNVTAGSIDVDVAPYPVTMERIRMVGRVGDLGGLPRSGAVYTTASDDPDALDVLLTNFNLEPVGGELVIELPPDARGRYVRIEWDSLQDPADTRTQIAEIALDYSEACIPQGSEFLLSSNGNSINGNVILNAGARGVFDQSGTSRVAGTGPVGIDLGNEASYNVVSDHLIADRQFIPTMVDGIRTGDSGVANVVTDNITTYDVQKETLQLWVLH